jgi:peptidoglycan LD-endopeptidase LytH
MSNSELNYFPIMGRVYTAQDFTRIDLSVHNSNLPNSPTYQLLDDYVNQVKEHHKAQWAIGGYREKRNLYQTSEHFAGMDRRDLHLGIDVWGPANSPIYCPTDGVIHSFAYNDKALDYGYALIIQHQDFYTLYGHLGSSHFDSWQVGKTVSKGEVIATLGGKNENGGWPPHLHFQIILSIDDWKGDYPGVCSESDKDYYFTNCPDPGIFFDGIIK